MLAIPGHVAEDVSVIDFCKKSNVNDIGLEFYVKLQYMLDVDSIQYYDIHKQHHVGQTNGVISKITAAT